MSHRDSDSSTSSISSSSSSDSTSRSSASATFIVSGPTASSRSRSESPVRRTRSSSSYSLRSQCDGRKCRKCSNCARGRSYSPICRRKKIQKPVTRSSRSSNEKKSSGRSTSIEDSRLERQRRLHKKSPKKRVSFGSSKTNSSGRKEQIRKRHRRSSNRQRLRSPSPGDSPRRKRSTSQSNSERSPSKSLHSDTFSDAVIPTPSSSAPAACCSTPLRDEAPIFHPNVSVIHKPSSATRGNLKEPSPRLPPARETPPPSVLKLTFPCTIRTTNTLYHKKDELHLESSTLIVSADASEEEIRIMMRKEGLEKVHRSFSISEDDRRLGMMVVRVVVGDKFVFIQRRHVMKEYEKMDNIRSFDYKPFFSVGEVMINRESQPRSLTIHCGHSINGNYNSISNSEVLTVSFDPVNHQKTLITEPLNLLRECPEVKATNGQEFYFNEWSKITRKTIEVTRESKISKELWNKGTGWSDMHRRIYDTAFADEKRTLAPISTSHYINGHASLSESLLLTPREKQRFVAPSSAPRRIAADHQPMIIEAESPRVLPKKSASQAGIPANFVFPPPTPKTPVQVETILLSQTPPGTSTGLNNGEIYDTDVMISPSMDLRTPTPNVPPPPKTPQKEETFKIIHTTPKRPSDVISRRDTRRKRESKDVSVEGARKGDATANTTVRATPLLKSSSNKTAPEPSISSKKTKTTPKSDVSIGTTQKTQTSKKSSTASGKSKKAKTSVKTSKKGDKTAKTTVPTPLLKSSKTTDMPSKKTYSVSKKTRTMKTSKKASKSVSTGGRKKAQPKKSASQPGVPKNFVFPPPTGEQMERDLLLKTPPGIPESCKNGETCDLDDDMIYPSLDLYQLKPSVVPPPKDFQKKASTNSKKASIVSKKTTTMQSSKKVPKSQVSIGGTQKTQKSTMKSSDSKKATQTTVASVTMGSQKTPRSKIVVSQPSDGPLVSRVQTKPVGRLVVNAPLDVSEVTPVLIFNNGPSDIAWSMKTTRPEIFEANPAYGILEAGRNINSFVSFKGFKGEEKPKKSDRLTVLWVDVEKGAAFSRELFGKDVVTAKKTLPIEYNV